MDAVCFCDDDAASAATVLDDDTLLLVFCCVDNFILPRDELYSNSGCVEEFYRDFGSRK